MADYILSLSYGKDSLACLGAIEKLGLPLTRIVHAEVWATDTIPADLPPMAEFKKKADKIILERYGIEVEHFKSSETYESGFYKVYGLRSRKSGEIWGFPFASFSGGNWCQSLLKRKALEMLPKNCIQYVGIASDEPNRFHNLSDKKRSPLVEAGWTEGMCREWCEENDLLSPIYTDSTRGGCWFCHNQGVGQLRLLRKNYHEYWALLLKWDNDSPVTFRSDGHTVHDIEERFALEDAGLISPNDKWLWGYLKDTPIQMKLNV